MFHLERSRANAESGSAGTDAAVSLAEFSLRAIAVKVV
jgi:hypothetical protein